MAESSEETARRCPKCKMPGEPVSVVPVPSKPGDKVHTMMCRNDRCTWFNTGWIYQVKADGTIPVRRPGPKQFEPLSAYAETVARDQIREAKDI